MDKTRYIRRTLLGIALLVCLTGCSSTYEMDPSTVSEPRTGEIVGGAERATDPFDPTQVTTAPVPTESTVSGQAETLDTPAQQPGMASTVPGETQPTQTEPTQTEPPKNESAQPEPTQPPAPTETIQPQPVIDRAVSAMASRMPDAKYDASCNSGTTVRLSVPAKQSGQAMADKIVSDVLQLFADDPDETYTYKLDYQGFDTAQNCHIFTVTYKIDVEFSQEATLDSATVVARTTQRVQGSDLIQVNPFSSGDYKECISIRSVSYFYGTEEAIDCLADEVEMKIYTKNLQGAGYTEFRIAFGSKEDTCYVFLLYLR